MIKNVYNTDIYVTQVKKNHRLQLQSITSAGNGNYSSEKLECADAARHIILSQAKVSSDDVCKQLMSPVVNPIKVFFLNGYENIFVAQRLTLV